MNSASALLAALCAIACGEAAAVYRCDAPGQAPTFQDSPCPGSVAPTAAAPTVPPPRAPTASAPVASSLAERKASAADAVERFKQENLADPKRTAESSCASAIAEKMPYLEPIPPYVMQAPGQFDSAGDARVRVAVRLADSFRAAPVGVVECEVMLATRFTTVRKVPR